MGIMAELRGREAVVVWGNSEVRLERARLYL